MRAFTSSEVRPVATSTPCRDRKTAVPAEEQVQPLALPMIPISRTGSPRSNGDNRYTDLDLCRATPCLHIHRHFPGKAEGILGAVFTVRDARAGLDVPNAGCDGSRSEDAQCFPDVRDIAFLHADKQEPLPQRDLDEGDGEFFGYPGPWSRGLRVLQHPPVSGSGSHRCRPAGALRHRWYRS